MERLTVSIDQCAKQLGIAKGTAYRLAHMGRLPVLRLGKRMLVPKAALERMLQEVDVLDDQESPRKPAIAREKTID